MNTSTFLKTEKIAFAVMLLLFFKPVAVFGLLHTDMYPGQTYGRAVAIIGILTLCELVSLVIPAAGLTRNRSGTPVLLHIGYLLLFLAGAAFSYFILSIAVP